METITPTEDKAAKIRVFFAFSVSILLLLTGFAKFIAIIENRPFLAVPDAVFTFMKMRDSLSIAAVLECIVGFYVLLKRRKLSSMVATLWLTSTFICYRMLSTAFYAKAPCRCLGGALDWTGLPTSFLDAIPVAILFYMGLGGLCFLIFPLPARPTVKTAC